MGKYPRVLLLAQYDHFGGTRTYAKQLVAFYAKHQFDTVVLALGPIDADMAQHCEKHGAALLRYEDKASGRVTLPRWPWHLRNERKLLDTFISDGGFDLITASVGTPGLFLGHMGLGRRSIYILHTYPWLERLMLRPFMPKAWARFTPSGTNFLTVSEFSRMRMLEAWGLDPLKHRISVIYNTAGDVTNSYREEKSTVNVLTIGHVVEYKNPMLWIEAAAQSLKQMPDLRFIWVGPGPLLEACREQVAKLRLQDKIVFTGESRNVDEYYEGCDIYLQPSRVENFSMSVLDAMRHGKPCIVSNVGGMPELAVQGESGWIVDISDPRALHDRILQLAASREARAKMGDRGREIYRQRFGPDIWDQALLALHERVLDRQLSPNRAE